MGFKNKNTFFSALCSFHPSGALSVHLASSCLPLTSYVLDSVSLPPRITCGIPAARLIQGQLRFVGTVFSDLSAHVQAQLRYASQSGIGWKQKTHWWTSFRLGCRIDKEPIPLCPALTKPAHQWVYGYRCNGATRDYQPRDIRILTTNLSACQYTFF